MVTLLVSSKAKYIIHYKTGISALTEYGVHFKRSPFTSSELDMAWLKLSTELKKMKLVLRSGNCLLNVTKYMCNELHLYSDMFVLILAMLGSENTHEVDKQKHV